jgi:hypothetical protein
VNELKPTDEIGTRFVMNDEPARRNFRFDKFFPQPVNHGSLIRTVPQVATRGWKQEWVFVAKWLPSQIFFSGYPFSIGVTEGNFTAIANPVSPNTGHYGNTSDGVIRYSTAAVLPPPGLAGRPIP